MENRFNFENTFDRTVRSLCEEVDDLKHEVRFWKEKYEAERLELMEHLNQSIASSKKGIATALMLAFSVTDDEHGNLVLSKEDRSELAKQFK